MNIKGIIFQSENTAGGRVSNFELSVIRVLGHSSVGNREYLTVSEFAQFARISTVSAYRYWQNIWDNYEHGKISDNSGCIQAVKIAPLPRRKMFLVSKIAWLGAR